VKTYVLCCNFKVSFHYQYGFLVIVISIGGSLVELVHLYFLLVLLLNDLLEEAIPPLPRKALLSLLQLLLHYEIHQLTFILCVVVHFMLLVDQHLQLFLESEHPVDLRSPELSDDLVEGQVEHKDHGYDTDDHQVK
jgi:hypothetical protein